MWQNFRSTVLDIALSVIFAIAQNDSCAYSLLRQHFWDNADDADNTVEGLTHFNIPCTYSLKTGKPLVFLFPCGYRQKQLPEVFYKKCVLRNFTKLTGKHLCQSLFFNKVAGLRPPGRLLPYRTGQLARNELRSSRIIKL